MNMTSIRCYRQIVDEGLLSKRRMQVYEALACCTGPATAGEIHQVLLSMHPGKIVMSHNHVNSRLTELKEQKVISDHYDARICRITGRLCLTWQLEDCLPDKLTHEVRVSAKDQVIALTEENRILRDRVEHLEKQLTELRTPPKNQLQLGL